MSQIKSSVGFGVAVWAASYVVSSIISADVAVVLSASTMYAVFSNDAA